MLEFEKKNHRKKEFIWNFIGSLCFAAEYPILTMFSSKLFGIEESGMFSVAFSTAQLFLNIGNYGIRVFQVSDINEEYTYRTYQIARYITCSFMLISNMFFCYLKKYYGVFFIINVMLCFYKLIDSLADINEGRLQQKNLLDKAGQSLFLRSTISILCFILISIWKKNIILSLASLIASSLLLFYFKALMPASNYTNTSKIFSWKNVLDLLKKGFPLFFSIFLFTYIVISPKYALEKIMEYKYQTFFNAIFFPSQTIYLFTGFIFKPLIVQMAVLLEKKRKKDLLIFSIKVFGFIFLFTLLTCLIIYFKGYIFMGKLYNVSLNNYRGMSVIMIISGGIIALDNYLYQVLAIMRKQTLLQFIYTIIFFISLFLPNILVEKYKMIGACLSYLILLISILIPLLIIFLSTLYLGESNDKKTIR